MFRLLNFIIELRDVVALVLAIFISLLLIISTDQDSGGAFRTIALESVGWIGQSVYRIESYFDLREEIKDLRRQNAVLAYENLQLQDALLENLRLRKLLDFKEKSQLNLATAEIIGQNPQDVLNGLILNAGSSSGIGRLAAVFTADGLVGKIVKVDKDYSICQILLSPNSRISAIVQRNRERGVISWDGGNLLEMLYIAKTIKIHVGDVILTSGMSQIFPENIKIGVVIDVILDKEGMFQKILVQPAVDFNRLEEVQIKISEMTDGS